MKILYTSFAVLLAASSIAIGDMDCEILPFSGRESTYTIVYDRNRYYGDHDNNLKWEVIQTPIGGYIGDILIKDESAVGTRARMRCFDITTEDLLKPQEDQPKINWFGDMGLYNSEARQRRKFYEHIWHIENVPFKVPIIIPSSSRQLGRCVFEIVDDSGDILYSCVPAEVFQGQRSYNSHLNSAWIFNEDEESDRRMKQYAKVNTLETLSEIPGDWTHFLNVKAIWIDETTDLSPELMRRFILSGGLIFGKTEGIEPQAAKLEMKPASILMGGIHPLEKKREEDTPSISYPFSSSYNRYSSSGARFQFRGYKYINDDHANPMEDAVHLFDRIKPAYLIFTFSVAGLYALTAVVLLPLLFFRLKGSQRVELWWKTPLAISGYTVIIALIGFIAIYPKATVSDATEYRLGYSDWPEVFCNINSASLRFAGKQFGWEFPKSTARTYYDNRENDVSIEEQPDASGTIETKRVVRGMQVLNGFAYMKKMQQPFSATLDGEAVKISTERDVRNICVCLANDKWIELGELKKGESLTLPDTFETVNIDFPDAIKTNLRSTHKTRITLAKGQKDAKPCKNCNKVHTHSDKSLQLYDGSILIIAVDETDKPAISGIQEQQDHTGRVVWICQVPVENYNSEPATKDAGTQE